MKKKEKGQKLGYDRCPYLSFSVTGFKKIRFLNQRVEET